MPAAALSLLFGCWLFQQQASLWSGQVWGWAGFIACLLTVTAHGLSTYTFTPSATQSRLQTLVNHCLAPLVRRKTLHQLLVLLLLALLGYGWAQARAYVRLQQALPAQCEGQVLTLELMVIGVPQQDRSGQHVDARITRSLSPQCQIDGRVRLHLYQTPFPELRRTSASAALPSSLPSSLTESSRASTHAPMLQAGSRWRCSVRLKRPHANRNPHGFDLAAWSLANHIIANGSLVTQAPMQLLSKRAWHPQAWLSVWRTSLAARITQVLGQGRESALVRALVIGDDSQLAPADWQLFLRSGINHLISISGLHITMLAALAYLTVQGLWRVWPALGMHMPSRQAGLLAGAAIATLYSLLAGFSIPTQRTLFMYLTIAGLLARKQQLPFSWVLSLALLTVLLLDPWAVLAPGFWLSFAAVAVLALGLGGRLRPANSGRTALQSQWVMTCAFFPVLLGMFNQVSLVAPLTNLIAIPLVSLLLVPLAIAGVMLPWDSVLIMAGHLAAAVFSLVHALADGPWAVWSHATPEPWVWLLAMLGVLVLLMPRAWPLRLWGLTLCLPLLIPVTSGLQTGQMQATVLDVGQGLSVLIRTAKHQMLYDAGPAYRQGGDAGQRIVLPYLRHLGIHALDVAIVSHDDNDHAGGMAAVLAELPTLRLLSSLSPEASLFRQLDSLANAATLRRQPCQRGQHWVWDGVHFEVLSPMAETDATDKDNDRSCVLMVRSAHGSLLLTGDIEHIAEQRLLASQTALTATVMTMPHHGSKTSSSPAFVQAVHAQVAIASVGYRNRFGHPKAEVMARYAELNTRIYRSDQHGAVLLDFVHGTQPRITAWREAEPHYWETASALQSVTR